MIELTSFIKELPNIAKLASQLRDLAQHNPDLIRELQKWGLDPNQPPQDLDAIYAWTLVKYYDESKSELVIKFFGEEKIRKAFLEDFTSNNLPKFLSEGEDFINRKGLNNDF